MTITHALIISTEGLEPADISAITEFTEARRVRPAATGSEAVLGWTPDTAVTLLLRLAGDPRSRVRLQTLIRALQSGGAVERPTVYEIAGFDRSRSLRGFTRPLRRHMAAMRDEGLLGADAVVPLRPIYDPNDASYQQTLGFEVPAPLVELFSSVVPASSD